MPTDLSRGILYVATGAAFQAEAIVSARSVKAVWPDVPIAVITDGPIDAACFDIVQIVAVEGNNIDRVRYIAQSPFERTITLDSDTYCLQAFPEVFDLLDRYQLAAAHESGRFATRWDPATGTEVFIRAKDVPECFPELNTGVVAFRRHPDVLAVFDRWLAACRNVRQAPVPHTQDQPSFRQVVYDSDLRVAVLPPEYNFRLVCPGYARNAIKIIHGRWKYGGLGGTSAEVYAALGRAFNANVGPRVFVHAFGMICGHGPSVIPLDDPGRGRELGVLPHPGAAVEQLRARS
jgi:hypothetical protein